MLSAHCSFQLHLGRIAFFILSHASYEKNEELGDLECSTASLALQVAFFNCHSSVRILPVLQLPLLHILKRLPFGSPA